MRNRVRWSVVATGLLLMSAACNAILGIGDLSAPDLPDTRDGSTEGASPLTDGAQPDDARSDANDGACDPCTVIESQPDASIFPTWFITSDLTIKNVNVSIAEPRRPVYLDAGAGSVRESTSGLTWRTAYAAASVSYAGAVAACKALGGDWRVPTRIEIATTQYRSAELTADSGTRTSCVPPPFAPASPSNVWTSTTVPPAVDAGVALYVASDVSCAFLSTTPDQTSSVRCVKGLTKPATFAVSGSSNIVHAVDTDLDWERTGTVIQKFAQAKAHCDSIGWRLPVIQELYGIADTRVLTLTDKRVFVPPPAAARAMLSQTLLLVGPDGTPYYAAISLVEGARGEEDAMSLDDLIPDIFLRCVRQHVP